MQQMRYVATTGLMGLLVCSTAAAQDTDSSRVDSSRVDSSRVDTAATGALTRMGAYLRTLKSFEIKGNVTREEVAEDGQKIQIASKVDVVAERPNRLRAELASDRKRRLYFYDGSTFTVFAPRQNFYATVSAPSTLNELANHLEDTYDIELPFVDLFRWGTPEGNVNVITAAVDVGPSEVEGVTCEQYAFRQEGLDWQVWIQAGQFPLPRKLVVTTLTDEARPQYSATYTWNLAPSFDKSSFVFEAPKEAKKIAIADVRAIKRDPKASGGNGK